MKVIGAGKVGAKFRKMPFEVRRQLADVNEKSGDELVRISRLLHPGDGENKAAIHAQPMADAAVLVDFGPKAKVTEGDRGPRAYVNPALKVTRKKHAARAKRAMKKAVKTVFGGG